MDKFENDLIDIFEEEFSSIEATREFKEKAFIKNSKKFNFRKIFSRFWNYELEIDLRAAVAIGLLIVIVPFGFIIKKTKEFEANDIKIYQEIKGK